MTGGPEGAGLPAGCDVAIVGAGPAGLGAAVRLKALGIDAVVLDREAEAGGIPRHCGHYPFGMREFHRVLKGPDYARRLVEEAQAAGVRLFPQTTVVALEKGPRLIVATPAGKAALQAKRVLLATGVRERSRAGRLVGGNRPFGVISTGALQQLVYLKGARPFLRPVIVGSELVSFSAILTCRHAGIQPVAMVEANDRVTAWWFAAGLARLTAVPLHMKTKVMRVLGRDLVEGVEVRDAAGRERSIEADGVIFTGQFLPEVPLLRAAGLVLDPGSGGPAVDQFGRCSDPAVFAAGNLLRPVETAGWSWREGVFAAGMIARSLAGHLPDAAANVQIRPRDGSAIRFVMPQRLALSVVEGAMASAQIRVTRPLRGTLVARQNGKTLWSGRIASRPERRLLLPLQPLVAQAVAGTIEVGLSDEF
ncbi:FAD-dependent oxidoreductase [Pelagibius litoralis]|uniref:FAD-dependent oxidoreductase n=1 Tax=Pelagibius litoralis TaxID=374515 RepID=A0A967K6G0_9PROT|nr:FAD-dependent oxidoreductase [Pelagibius litoralis]NIA69223.1 FAD-dependent oxidoreductase [Pelagibius litoralis]